MSFFNNCQKKLANKTSYSNLKNAYELSEQRLRNVAKTGNERALKKAMSEHRCYEYALLYKNTPAYKKNLTKGGRRK